MASIYEEVEIEDMLYDKETQIYSYPCPCGDRFQISLEDLHDGEDIATCPSCTLRIKVIFEEDSLPKLPSFNGEEEDEETEVRAASDTLAVDDQSEGAADKDEV